MPETTGAAGRWIGVILSFLAGLSLLGAAMPAGAEPSIIATRYPLAWFAQRIAGPEVTVELADPPVDGSPWRPTLEDIRVLQRARLILVDDPARETWLDVVALKAGQVVDVTAGLGAASIPAPGEITHTHGPTGAHSHGASAQNPWLDPTLAVVLARSIAEAIRRRGLGDEGSIDDRLRGLTTDLLAIDELLETVAANAGDVLFLAPGPDYAYLARRYGLRIRTVTWPADVSPAEPGRARNEHAAVWMIWPRAPGPDDVAYLREAGIESLVFDPLARRPAEGDFLTAMRRNAEQLREALAAP